MLDNIQAKARTLHVLYVPGPEEAVEKMLLVLFRNADAVVNDANGVVVLDLPGDDLNVHARIGIFGGVGYEVD